MLWQAAEVTGSAPRNHQPVVAVSAVGGEALGRREAEGTGGGGSGEE